MKLPEAFNEPPTFPLDLFDTFRPVVNMAHRAILCLTAFFASSSLFTSTGQPGPYAQAQYLLGLGEASPDYFHSGQSQFTFTFPRNRRHHRVR